MAGIIHRALENIATSNVRLAPGIAKNASRIATDACVRALSLLCDFARFGRYTVSTISSIVRR
jgi:hypothetical protein